MKVAILYAREGICSSITETLIEGDLFYEKYNELSYRKDVLTIRELVVEEGFRGQGIGSEILQHMLDVYYEEGFNTILIEVHPVQHTGNPAYIRDAQDLLVELHKGLGFHVKDQFYVRSNKCKRAIIMGIDL